MWKDSLSHKKQKFLYTSLKLDYYYYYIFQTPKIFYLYLLLVYELLTT
jgi:hypothetical protein